MLGPFRSNIFYVLPSITGLTAWVDYVPYAQVTDLVTNRDRTDANGGIYATQITSITGLRAWVDYIPVYPVSVNTANQWRFDNTGYFPVVPTFTPLNLFLASEKGAWFDPSDISTLFQDSAGTTPVTAVEQPVGKILDKSGNLAHATQATAGNRPTYRARYNLLTQSQAFNISWPTTGVAVAINQALAPDNTSTANKITEDGTTGQHFISQSFTFLATTYTYTCYVQRAVGTRNVMVYMQGSTFAGIQIDLGTLAVTQLAGSTASGISGSVTAAGGGWYRCSVTATIGAGVGSVAIYMLSGTANSYTGDTTSALYAWGADLRYGTSTTFPYQSITTATSYNAVGFLPYLAFNGSTTSLLTGNIDLTATSQTTTFVGLTKSSDAAQAAPFSFGTIASVAGSFEFNAPATIATADYAMVIRGNATLSAYKYTTFASPITNVISSLIDFNAATGAEVASRVNAVTPTTATGVEAGAGPFANGALSVGSRVGGLFFNGNLYGLIVRGASSTAAEIASTEAWINSRCGAF